MDNTIKTLARPPFVSPFQDWNARSGYWQNRKRKWRSIGITSELGRADNLAYKIPEYLRDGRPGCRVASGTSIFDPVTCELCYFHWCPQGGLVIDPFAGGSVRGIVASIKGLRYWGCDLRQEQVDANKAQLNKRTLGRHRPKWVCGDSYQRLRKAPLADFLFSCPPYGDLEKYSDDPADLSNMDFDTFAKRYAAVVKKACKRLRDNRFAAFVVGAYRDKRRKQLRDLPGITIKAFQDAGLTYVNQTVITLPIGSSAMRAARRYLKTRQVAHPQQFVIVCVKGSDVEACRHIKESLQSNCTDNLHKESPIKRPK